MKLSVVMMIKNESKHLEKCLMSIMPIKEAISTEIIIVDTGSEDESVEIAKRYTDKVFFHEWTNDFAEMRNITFSYAKGDWLFVLDGDEVIEQPNEIISFLKSNKGKVHNTGIINIKSFTSEEEKKYASILMPRLFRNEKDFQYVGAIHEQPKMKGPYYTFKSSLLHYGYVSNDKKLLKKKYERNTEILIKELEKDSKNAYYWFQLAQSYLHYNKLEEALDANLKAYKVSEEKKDLSQRMYIYNHLALVYFKLEKFEKLEEICLEALKVKDGYIDLYYFLAYAQQKLSKNQEAIKTFLIYLDMASRYDDFAGSKDISVSTCTLDLQESAYLSLVYLNYREQQYNQVLFYKDYIKTVDFLRISIKSVVGSYVGLKQYDKLKLYYDEIILKNDKDLINEVVNSIEVTIEADESNLEDIIQVFANGTDNYALLNKVRLNIKGISSLGCEDLFNDLDFNNLPECYGDVVLYLLKNQKLIDSIHNVWEGKLEKLLIYAFKKNKESFSTILLDFISSYSWSNSLEQLKTKKTLERVLLNSGELNDEDYESIFNKYTLDGIHYINNIYNANIIEMEKIYHLKNEEEAFFLYLDKALKIKFDDSVRFVKYLKKALNVYPFMARGIEIYLKEINSVVVASIPNKELDEYKAKIKQEIQVLINQGQVETALLIIQEFEEAIQDDIDIYGMKAIASMMKEDFEAAEKILLEGLSKEGRNCDLLYNLAYLYEVKNRTREAYKVYKKLYENASGELLSEVKEKISLYEKNMDKAVSSFRKKVLIIAYAFPPIGGSGIQRTLKFVKYLREFGWEPVVLTVGETAWTMKDMTLLDEIPKDVEVLRIDDIKPEEIDNTFIRQLVGMYGQIIDNPELLQDYIQALNREENAIQNLLFLPEYQAGWAMRVIEKIETCLDLSEIEMVYTSADPYADTFIGFHLKTHYNIPWVADFRDEWTNHHYKNYDKNSIQYRLEYAMEQAVVNRADRIITTTPISSENYRNIFGLEKDKVITITNGYDEDDFEGIISQKKANDFFTIMHNGLFHHGKNPITFLKALSNLIEKGNINKERIKVYFTREDGYEQIIKSLDLEKVVEYLGYLEHKQSLEFANNCDALLLIVGEGDKLKQVHAAKLFEYLRLGKTILSLAPKEGVIDQLVNELDRGFNVEYNDIIGIEKYLLSLYKDWECGKLKQWDVTKYVERFERKSLTKDLSNIFDYLLKESKTSSIKKMINENKIEEAKKKLDILMEEYKDSTTYCLLGVILMLEENFNKAEEAFLIGLEFDDSNYDILYNLGFLYYEIKKDALKAKEYFALAEKKCPIEEKESIQEYLLKVNIEKFNNDKKLTVVMTTFNRADYIEMAIESVLCQTYREFDFIILDNCSTDNTEEVVRKFKDPRIKYIRNSQNLGFVGNINKAFELCQTEYLSIVHDDDILNKNLFEKEIKILEENTNISLVGTNRTYIDEKGHTIKDLYSFSEDIKLSKYELIKSGLVICLPSVMYRAPFIKKNKLIFNEYIGLTADTYFFFELNMLDTVIYFIAEPLIYYRVHSNQESKKDVFIESRLRFCEMLYHKAYESNLTWLLEYSKNFMAQTLFEMLAIQDCKEDLFYKSINILFDNDKIQILSDSHRDIIDLIIQVNKNESEDLQIKSNLKYLYDKNNKFITQNKSETIAVYGQGLLTYLFIKQYLSKNKNIECIVCMDPKNKVFNNVIPILDLAEVDQRNLNCPLLVVEEDEAFSLNRSKLQKMFKSIIYLDTY